MRIVWVSPHCWPDHILREDGLGKKSQGGQTVVMYQATIALAEAFLDLQVDIYARYEDGDSVEIDIHPRVRIIRLPLGPTDRYLPKEEFWGPPIEGFVGEVAAYAKARGLRYDLIHGHYADGWYVAHHLAKRWKVPFLCATHSLGIRKRDNALRMKEGTAEELDEKYSFSARIQHEQAALDAADCICPLTIEEGAYIADKYAADPAKIRVVNNGVMVSDFYPPDEQKLVALRSRLNLGPDDLPVLLIARLDPRKGQRELIEAAPLVVEQVRRASAKNVKFLFVAWVETAFSRSLERRVDELGIREHVIYHPPVLNKEIAAFFWASAVYSLSSSYDIFPIVMLEAMASGLPVVATKNGGPSEIISPGEEGYLVEPTDREELAAALVKVLADEKERARLGMNAHRKVVARYTWARIAERMMGVYREVLPQKRVGA
ncbi:MAG: glycosyltransferase family 1 protein [bacterium]|nr:glycosyltransferase family 1 protein [bacterium]